MKKLFEESKAEIIRFGTDVIVTSTSDSGAGEGTDTGDGPELEE